ncbi:MAG: LytTR family DNA-binding domain-containing protein [Lachnospiraceae bacterium]|nr:LytTR family DNA-binding domain-containing protein [Lachnospiraceae bacterium]
MSKLKIAVCDDEIEFVDEITKMIEVYGNEEQTNLQVWKYTNSLELMAEVQKNSKAYDIVFIDIDMPKLRGIELSKMIREVNEDVVICFVTSMPNYTREAYDVGAIGYIDKPYRYVELKKIMRRAEAEVLYIYDEKVAEEKYISIKNGQKIFYLNVNNILYVEKQRNKCLFHMTDTEYICYDTLKNVAKKLDDERFVFSHQGYIVNMEHVKNVLDEVVVLSQHVEVPLSRKNRSTIKKMFIDKMMKIGCER